MSGAMRETGGMTLTEFLLARIAEDEAVAVATRDSHDPLLWDDRMPNDATGMAGPVDGPSGYTSIVVSPARVLADCEAKRRIVETIRRADAIGDPARTPREWLLRELAAVYADHPDYREEWWA